MKMEEEVQPSLHTTLDGCSRSSNTRVANVTWTWSCRSQYTFMHICRAFDATRPNAVCDGSCFHQLWCVLSRSIRRGSDM